MKKLAFLAAFGLLWIGCKSGDEAAAPADGTTPTPATPSATSDAGGTASTVAFNQVQEIFNSRCVFCHGENGKDGVDLRSYASVMKGGEHGAIVKPGQPADSDLVKMIKPGAPKRMPLNQAPLTDEQIKMIEEWIAAGAKES